MRVSFPVGGPIYCSLQEQETCQSRRLFLVTTLLLGDCRETRWDLFGDRQERGGRQHRRLTLQREWLFFSLVFLYFCLHLINYLKAFLLSLGGIESVRHQLLRETT